MDHLYGKLVATYISPIGSNVGIGASPLKGKCSRPQQKSMRLPTTNRPSKIKWDLTKGPLSKVLELRGPFRGQKRIKLYEVNIQMLVKLVKPKSLEDFSM